MTHPFDRYAPFTNLAALKDASNRPLRKCVRVNTLKCSVETFKEWAKEKGWKLIPVLWSEEGFFLERDDHGTALGRDLRHLLGHFYMQEAASMLPAELLDLQPGEVILDLCAAPGSKTTQMAAALTPGPSPVGGRGETMQRSGIVIANDMQEKRLRILNDSIQRMGATNVIVTRKVGQWFGRHLAERFDRVLCDAPCTAQGTCRKDSTALDYCSPASIAKAANLQRALLEAAIHACKVGGRIVYSTCTLTPEENEQLVLETMNKFSDQLEVVNLDEFAPVRAQQVLQTAVNDSIIVQEHLQKEHGSPLSIIHYPFLRIWPQTYDTEGFFCAVLRKTAWTLPPEHMQMIARTSPVLSKSKKKMIHEEFQFLYGTDFLQEADELVERGEQVMLTTQEAVSFPLPLTEYATGIPYARDVGNGRYRLTNELVALRGERAKSQVMELSETELQQLLSGRDIPCSTGLKGDTVLLHRGIAIGLGLAKAGTLLNRLPRWVVKNASVSPSVLDPERSRASGASRGGVEG